MKKIINGKKYDTETAEELASYSNNLGVRDFRHVKESLYRKKNGEYFLCGEGGPLTQYAERCGDMMGDGESIRPLTEAEAREWVEAHSDAETYESIFGPVGDESDEKCPFCGEETELYLEKIEDGPDLLGSGDIARFCFCRCDSCGKKFKIVKIFKLISTKVTE